MINFCPPFFSMRRLQDAAIDYGKRKTPPLNQNIENYDNTARVFLHELFHLDYFMESTATNHVTDMSISYWRKKDAGTGEDLITEVAYSPRNTKMMAKFQEFNRNPIGRLAGSYVSRNADNLAWFATARCVQQRSGVYPHLPIVLKQIEGPPFKPPPRKPSGSLVSYGDDTHPVFNLTLDGNFTVADNITSPLGINDGLPADPSCPDDLAASAQMFDIGNVVIDLMLNLTGMANDTAYPADCIANLTSWVQSEFGATYVNDSSPTTISPTATPTPTCQGNQVEGNCIADTLPSAAPYSGEQGPACARADGGSGSAPRLNATLAQAAVSDYCNNLVNDNVVLSDSSGTVKPGEVVGQAENDSTMVLTVMYDVSSCPHDKSNSTLDLSTMGLDACYEFLFTVFDQECAQDSTWHDYNPNWTIEGGVFSTGCGLFALLGQLG